MPEPSVNIKTNDKLDTSKSWLQRLKDESWEAEILVSTVAIFGTFQLFGLIDWLTNFCIDKLSPNQYDIGYFIVCFGLFAVSILASMFVLHFVLRAYWVGLVGLNSVFPDYSLEDSAYSKIYTEKILAILPKLKDSIQKVDELCSVIFSVAFTFMFLYGYLSLLTSLYVFLFNFLIDYISIYIILLPVFLISVFFVLHMFISLIANIKKFKDNEKIQTYYFYAVKIGSVITCGPLGKSVMQVFMIFGSNFKKKKSMVYLLITFLFFGVIVSFFQFNKTNIPYLISQEKKADKMKVISSYYASENLENDFLLVPEIKSDFIEGNMLKVFIPVFSHEERMRKNTCDNYVADVTRTRAQQRQDKFNSYLACYKTYHHVFINTKKVTVDFLKYDHPRTKQFGILGYIKLENLKEGLNRLEIKKVFDNSAYNKDWSIPFYHVAE